jgi:hypothetical protein
MRSIESPFNYSPKNFPIFFQFFSNQNILEAQLRCAKCKETNPIEFQMRTFRPLLVISATFVCALFFVSQISPHSHVMAATTQEVKLDTQASQTFTHQVGSQQADVYGSSPAQSRPPDAKLSPGTQVNIVRTAGSYVFVQSATGVRGWVEEDLLVPVSSIQSSGGSSGGCF